MGADDFQYMQIEVRGCSSDRDDCFDAEEIAKKEINFNMIKAIPGLLSSDLSEAINYVQDVSHFWTLDPS